jgi:hypothetical protein
MASVLPESLLPNRERYMDVLSNMRGDTLPGFESDIVFKQLVSERLACWDGHVATLEKDVIRLMHEMMGRLVLHAVSASLPSLQSYLKNRLRQLVDQHADALKPRVQELLKTERQRPYTQNHYNSDILIKLRSQQLKERISKIQDQQGNVKHDAMIAVLESFGGGAMLLGSSSSPRCKQMNSDIEFCELLRPTLGLGILGGTESGCLGDWKFVVYLESCDVVSARKRLIFATLALVFGVYLRNASSMSASGWSSSTFIPLWC